MSDRLTDIYKRFKDLDWAAGHGDHASYNRRTAEDAHIEVPTPDDGDELHREIGFKGLAHEFRLMHPGAKRRLNLSLTIRDLKPEALAQYGQMLRDYEEQPLFDQRRDDDIADGEPVAIVVLSR